MLDPLSAISLASAIVQFVDFSAKIIQGAREVHGSMSGATEQNRSLEVVVDQMRDLVSRLSAPGQVQQSEDEKALGRVANECKILADQILDLLQKIKAKDPSSTLQAAWAALKNQKYKRQRLELEGRLESCRNHLEFQLSNLNSAETKTSLNTLVASTERLAENFRLLQKDVEQLRHGTTVTSIGPQAQEQFRELLQISDEALQKIKQQIVLKNLAYSDMETRFEEVSEEHSKTFEWIFEDTTQGDSYEGDASSKVSFVDWLSSGSGIFHICGKLGSGKSTLMKFLCNHPRTETELQDWAGDRKLIFAKFFFWRGAKTAEQKSLKGLVRSILYETLRACPELIPDTLPDLWAQLDSFAWQVEMKLNLSKLQTRAAVSSLIKHRNLYKEHCFCFFVDGLDEFETTTHDGYGDLIKLLKSWSDVAPKAVKICVSSREDLVFMGAFSTERRFRLQDLTREDIQRYVRDKLQVAADEKGQELIETITDRAEGIFLWVALVVKSIRDQLDEEYELSECEKALDELPNELNKLFEHLLKSIRSTGSQRAHRTFAMVLTLRGQHLNFSSLDLSLLAYSFLGDYEKNPAFAMEELFPFSKMDNDTRRSREYDARKRLYRDCKRLLEVNEHEATITVTHRSILEFLESQPAKDKMGCSLEGFSAEDAISQLFLAELRCKEAEITDESVSLVVNTLTRMRHQSNMDQEPYRFQEALSSAVNFYPGMDLEEQMKCRIAIALTKHEHVILGDRNCESFYFITSPLYLSAYNEAYEYVRWKMQSDPTIIGKNFEIGILVCCAESGIFDSPKPCRTMKFLEFLLTKGLSANAMIHNCAANNAFKGELSFWQYFILSFPTLLFLQADMAEGRKEIGETVEKFLAHDADPHLWISRSQHSPGPKTRETRFRVTLGRDRTKYTVLEVEEGDGPLPVEEGEEVSLRQMLESCKFDNGEAILQLLDRNARRRELRADVDELAHDQSSGDQEECEEQDLDIPGLETEQQLAPESAVEEPEERPIVTDPLITKDSRPWLELTGRTHFFSVLLSVLVGFVLSRLWATITTQSSMREGRAVEEP